MKVLGYWLTCNGDHVRNMSSMRGALRGKLAMMDKRFVSVPRMVKAKWWQLQLRGVVGFYASFIGLGRTIMRQLAPVNNSGARKVLGVRPFYNNGSELNRVQEHYRICVQTFFCHSIVQYLGLCFRHIEIPISRLLSLPLEGRLGALRSQHGRAESSDTAQAHRSILSNLGIQLGELIAGRLDVRRQTGYIFRWGSGWFSEIRDSGPGWVIPRKDKDAILVRVQLLLDIFRPRSNLPQLADVVLPIEDG